MFGGVNVDKYPKKLEKTFRAILFDFFINTKTRTAKAEWCFRSRIQYRLSR